MIGENKMNKEKQIEEMARTICGLNTSEGCFCDGGYCNYNCLAYEKATALYNAGYRKESEVEYWTAFEIFEKIEGVIAEYERLKRVGFQHDDKWRLENIVADILAIKEEYEGGKNGKSD